MKIDAAVIRMQAGIQRAEAQGFMILAASMRKFLADYLNEGTTK